MSEEKDTPYISEVERKNKQERRKKLKGGGSLSEIVSSENTKIAGMPAADIKRQIQ